MNRETNTGEILMIIASFYERKNQYVQEFTKKLS